MDTKQTDDTPTDASPAATLHRMGNGFWISQALYVVAKLGVADHMKHESRHVHDIATSVGAHEDSLYRVMRALASVGVFTEPQPKCFALTSLGVYLRSDVPGSLRAQFFGITELDWQPWGHLLHCVKTGESALQHMYGMGLFGYLQANPEVSRMFDDAMTGFVTENGLAVISAYDFTVFDTIVDVGGGHGALMTALLNASPHAKGVVFDLPNVIEGAKRNIELAGLSTRCACVAGDFFTSVPTGGDVYIAVSIIHDWDDKSCVRILENIRNAMTSSAKLLMVEMVIPPGDAPFYGKLLDVNMLVLTGGRERTKREYADLLTSAGFQLTGIVPTRTSSSIIEAQPI